MAKKKTAAKRAKPETLKLKKLERIDGFDGPIYVLDNQFYKTEMRTLYKFLRFQEYALADYDTDATKFIQHWICELDAKNAVRKQELLRYMFEIVCHVFSEVPLEPSRIHANLHMYGDLQNAHVDFGRHNGVTAVYYANPEWKPEWLGETIFYRDKTEPRLAIAPKPGRLVMFPGHIIHRAGVPARNCYEPRISLAFKCAIKHGTKGR